MAAPFSQTVIAVVWDFDKTLIAGNMQAPLFRRYGVDERAFWEEVDQLRDFYLAHGAQRVNDDVLYLNHILEYVRAGAFKGLSNAVLRELGAELTFLPGMPEFMSTLRRVVEDDPVFQRADISVEHYIVSTGLRPMIEGSAIRPHVDDVWACEFIEAHHPPGFTRPEQGQLFPRPQIVALGYQIDNTSKTRALFEIHKGSNKRPEIHVNAAMPRELRRVPFENMIYVADGPSDVPAWSVVRGNGGMTFGVYQRGSLAQFEQISALQRDGRIHAFAEADYRPDSTAHLWLTSEVRRIAQRIADERDALLRRAVRAAPRHVAETPAATTTGGPMEGPLDLPQPATSIPPSVADAPPARPADAEAIREAVRRSMVEEPAAEEEAAAERLEAAQDRLRF
ncbi:MAG TPA: HAD family hydrolase [candidate division Zixibacteria bacterium]|nr:HAD family hydrolase [candidate division Zixibacteria bacterium]